MNKDFFDQIDEIFREEEAWTVQKMIITAVILLCFAAIVVVVGYWSYKAWVWSFIQLAKYWGYL